MWPSGNSGHRPWILLSQDHILHSEPLIDHPEGGDGLAQKAQWVRANTWVVGDSSSERSCWVRAQDLMPLDLVQSSASLSSSSVALVHGRSQFPQMQSLAQD